MKPRELKKKFLDFFVKKGHQVLPNVSLIPENDPTALFISAGMHPLVPYLLSEPHPLGKRLCSLQRCLRTDDIDSVGDFYHHTFFEMLGNWSLGDYWKKEAISWSWEFLTEELKLEKERIFVSCFVGDKDAPRDEESAKIWQEVGVPGERINFYEKKDNWWGPAGKTGPCGPDTEMFYDLTRKPCGQNCRPNDGCGRFLEIWNDVFMEYEKRTKSEGGKEYEFVPLKQKNVDTGMGVERIMAVLSGLSDNYQTEIFIPIIRVIEEMSGKSYREEENRRPIRIIADHLRAATVLIADGVVPSNVEKGYILRRLVRRAVRFGRMLQLDKGFTPEIAKAVISTLKEDYPHIEKNREIIFQVLLLEEEKFRKALDRGLKEIERYPVIDGKIAFYLYETYGFPLEMTEEIAVERGQKVGKNSFEDEFRRHQEISRLGAGKKFAGGLADHSEAASKYHTATHLLHAALRLVLGPHVFQRGSNITRERLRFDFSHPRKVAEEELKRIENLVNEKIREDLPVEVVITTLEEAKKQKAIALFTEKYEGKVKVYKIGDFSLEVCGGPHASSTGVLGKFKIIKEEGVSAGVRRIYAVLAS